MSRPTRTSSSFRRRVMLRLRLSWTRWLLSRVAKQEHRRLEMLGLEQALTEAERRLAARRAALLLPPVAQAPAPLPEPEQLPWPVSPAEPVHQELQQMLPYLAPEEPPEPMPDPLAEIRSLLHQSSSSSSAD